MGAATRPSCARPASCPPTSTAAARSPVSVEIDNREVSLLYQRTIGKNTLLTMKLAGQADQMVMFKEVQREPVKGKFLHVDFYHVDPGPSHQAAHPGRARRHA